jgi:hypothetical protein
MAGRCGVTNSWAKCVCNFFAAKPKSMKEILHRSGLISGGRLYACFQSLLEGRLLRRPFFLVRQAWRVAPWLALFQSLWWWLDDLAVKVRYRPDKGND